MKKSGSGRRGRWAVRACAAGAAVAAAAGAGGAAMAATTTASVQVTTPVACLASALASAISSAPASAILVLKPGCTYRIPASLPEVTSDLTIVGDGDTITPANDDDFTALEVSGAELTISRLTFRGFFTGTDTEPGALINDGGSVTITSSRFTDNTGGDDGGAILNKAGATLDISSTEFQGNVSGVDDDCSAVRADCGSDGYGGAISNESGSEATLTADNFLDNHATEDGGAIYIGGGTVTVRGTGSSAGEAVDFTDNAAGGDYGGAIDNAGGSLVVSYAAFSHNSSPDYGGAIENDGGSASVSGSSFSHNHSEYGGAIETDFFPLNLTGDMLTGNSAYDGGAIIMYSNTTLNKTIVTGNHATSHGGGIYLSGGTASITNGSFVTGNTPDNCYGFSC
jgi:predicted outer membrane repeat protein